jgi:hypothetical protein
VHHFAADWKQWILFEQTELILPDHPALRCLALQHVIRHYCGSDDMRAAEQAQGKITLNHKHMRNAA